MKNVQVDYYDRKMEISVPDQALVLEGPKPPVMENPTKAIKEALDNPTGIEKLSDLVSRKSKVTIAFDDPSRPSYPRRVAVPIILEELKKLGVQEENIKLLSGNGTHCKWTKNEFTEYLGEGIVEKFWPLAGASRLVNHDCTEKLEYLGVSELGDYVEYNELVPNSDLLVYVGTVLSSNWGGYTGQGIIVGLGSAKSLSSHHSYAVIGHKESCHGDQRTMLYVKHKLAIHEQIEKAINKKIFYLDLMIGAQGRIAATMAGHVPEVTEQEWKKADELYRTKVPQSDVIVIGIPSPVLYGPSDNPIISLAAAATPPRIWLNKPLLREGGVLIAVVGCKGIFDENKHPSYPEALRLWGRYLSAGELYDWEDDFSNRPEWLHKYRNGYAYHGIHPLWLFYESQYMFDHASKIVFAGPGNNPGAVRALGVAPAKTFSDAWKMAEQIVGKDPATLVLPTFWSKPRPKFDVE